MVRLADLYQGPSPVETIRRSLRMSQSPKGRMIRSPALMSYYMVRAATSKQLQ
jgi:hypothetical protein